jgi:hypothetical protein
LLIIQSPSTPYGVSVVAVGLGGTGEKVGTATGATGAAADGAGAAADGAGAAADGAGRVSVAAAGAGTAETAGVASACGDADAATSLTGGASGTDSVTSRVTRPRAGVDASALVAFMPRRVGAAESERDALAESERDELADAREELFDPSVSAPATAGPLRIATPTPSAAAMPPTRPMNCAALMEPFPPRRLAGQVTKRPVA